jgi:hypothetical protein
MAASESDAEHIARLKATYPHWTIWRGTVTGAWWAAPPAAHPTRELLSAANLAGLEIALQRAEERREP